MNRDRPVKAPNSMQTNAPTVSVPAPATAILPYYTLFFISGFPALIYQIVWQRTLFAMPAFDPNIADG